MLANTLLLLNFCALVLSASIGWNSTFSPLAFASSASTKCPDADEVPRTISYFWRSGTKTDANKEGVLKGLDSFKRWLKQTPQEESFKYRDGDIVGYMWVGSMLQNSGFANNVVATFEKEVKDNGFPSSAYLEYFTGNAMKTFGIAFGTDGNLDKVQEAVKKWSSNSKFNYYTNRKQLPSTSVCYLKYENRKKIINDERAGKCFKYSIKGGEDLEKTTGVDAESLVGYNPKVDFESLEVNQPICYSVGKL